MPEAKIPILGVPPGLQPDASPRLELHEFVHPNNIKQYSLYIQALQTLYDRDYERSDSYFQIAAIHAKPYIRWNQAPGPEGRNIYCPHKLPLFSAWHRPYVVLLEQEIHKVAVELANHYPECEKAAWIQAAQSLRQPYWGWDADATILPPDAIIIHEKVEIIKAGVGKTVKITVDNPFYSFKFPEGALNKYFNETDDAPFHKRSETLRFPGEDEKSNPYKIKEYLGNEEYRLDITEDISNAYSAETDQKFTNRLEEIHGDIHFVIGGYRINRDKVKHQDHFIGGKAAGHMSFIEYTAFDPLFYTHHAEVDRLVQAYYDRKGSWDDGEHRNRDLLPFWKNDIEFWKPFQVNDHKATFNYTYDPPFEPPKPHELGPNPHWNISIRTKRFEVGGSYDVYVFLGQVPEKDPKHWIDDPNYVGSRAFFVNSDPKNCDNCSNNVGGIDTKYTCLNIKLEGAVKDGRLGSLQPDNVCAFLEKKIGSYWINLNWAILAADGRIILSKDLDSECPSLEVWVGSTTKWRKGKGLKPETYYPKVTYGRPGGAKEKKTDLDVYNVVAA